MKKLLLICLLHTGIIPVYSQRSSFQRISIPATSFQLNAAQVAQVVPSFCSDFNRLAPEARMQNFDYVHLDQKCVSIGNNPPITLQEALDAGYIDLEVNGFRSVKFKNLKKTNENIKISIQKDVIVGDVKNDSKNLLHGRELQHTSNPAIQEKMQRDFWERQSQVQSLT
jgi:hypothetical protein